jgi:hypothetical protein
MRFLNGFKTILGAAGLAIVALSRAEVLVLLPVPVQPYIAGASALLLALGIVHKVEKRLLPTP